MVALAVSMALIPLMIRIAPAVGMIDKPDPRKVHVTPIPRAGGVGIVIGALLPVLIWLPLTDTLIAYCLGAMILLLFGVWDDIAELGHYVKFIGQFLAAILVVYYGGVVVETFPFMGLEKLPLVIGKPFTVIALVGMINAVNHSDGLDGLAGGESLMSLMGILYLTSQVSSFESIVLIVAMMGGLFGFLRFNSHPARVFMGDGGSQVLGFSLGVFAVLLVQRDNPALSPALPLLLLGLPIADILMVFWMRARSGGNWFKATKNHIHHRLLELGFHHYESVAIIYTVQAALVFTAVTQPYAADIVLVTVYLAVCITLFAVLAWAESNGWRAHAAGDHGNIAQFILRARESTLIEVLPGRIVSVAVSLFMLVGAFIVGHVRTDLATMAGILGLLLLIRLVLGFRVWFLMLRLLVFVSIALLVYLVSFNSQDWTSGFAPVGYVFFGILGLALIVGVRVVKQDRFTVTPLDYLVVLIALALAFVPERSLQVSGLVGLAFRAIMLFYGAELAMRQMRSRWNYFTGSILVSLGVIAARGLL